MAACVRCESEGHRCRESKKGQSYVFVSNHRSYLDTAALFRYAGKRIGLVAKKELLKVPVLGQGMSFVNIIAIDRSNPEALARIHGEGT